MDNFVINRESDFKNSNISTVPLGTNNIKINNSNFDLKRDDISNNIKPMLSSGANTINISDGKKYKINHNAGKKIPLSTFSGLANNKKAIQSDSSESSYATEDSVESGTDEILSGNTHTSQRNSKTQYESGSDADDDEDDDDYSSIDSAVHNKNTTQTTNSQTEYTDDDEDDESEVSKPVKKMSYEEIQQEKQQMLFDLDRLQKQGYPTTKRYSMASSYEDIKYERDRLKKQRDVEKSIRFSRKILMGTVSGIEWLNKKFDYFDIKLSGWSENVLENISDYDEVFEELHDKYSESVKMAPELKLVSMVAGSAALFHITNSIFKSASPQLSDILKQNPDIMRNITEAAARNMTGNINQQFGENDFVGNMMKDGMNNKINQRFQQEPSRAGPQPQPKMSGPVGIDEILNELNDGGSVSSDGSVKMKTSPKRNFTQNKKGGIQLSI